MTAEAPGQTPSPPALRETRGVGGRMRTEASSAPAAVRRSPPPWRFVCAGALAFSLAAVAVANSLGWIGSTAPGFFVLPNGIISASSPPAWPSTSTLSGREVLAVEGLSLTSPGALYEYVRSQTPGTEVHYQLRSADGTVDNVAWRTQVVSVATYAWLFGIHLLNGVVLLCLALAVWGFRCRRPVVLALASASSLCGVFFVTAPDRFDPHWFFGLHLMTEALAAAALLHLAAVFPIQRLERRGEWVLPFLYLPAFLLGLVGQGSSSDPVTYRQFHLAATVALAAGAAAAAVAVLHGVLRARSILAQRQSALAGIGILAAATVMILPATLTGMPHGRTLLDAAASVSFLLPLCIAYAASKEDSSAIDSVLRRVLADALFLAVLAASFAALFQLSDGSVIAALAQSPLVLPILLLCVVLGTIGLRERAQGLADHVLFGESYDVEKALSALSQKLASTRTLDAVVGAARKGLGQTIRPCHADILVRQDDGTFRDPGAPAERPSAPLPTWRIARLERGELQLRQQEEGIRRPGEESSWTGLDAEILVPISSEGSLQAVLALGPKESERSYNAGDIRFLQTVARQISLALSNVRALQESREVTARLRDLHESHDRQVQERTAALQASNRELTKSLEKLQYAYVKLEQSQANLLRSDRLATLGRLTAGLAHEMNTPLSAVLNSLKLIRDLGLEYQSSIDDASVLPKDHHEIAAELIAHAQSATEWANKAAAFIRSVKAHGREARSGVAQRFAIRDVIADARGLVAHRLRATSCRIDLVEEPPGITLDGDPSRFNQVLVNLLTNAIDAYEDRGIDDARIEIRAWRHDDGVSIQVRDWAGGIPTSILPHIFDELYTTKGPGRGTGLGLWISRNIVEEALGGTLDVITNSEGSCFLAEFPQPSSEGQPLATRDVRAESVQAA